MFLVFCTSLTGQEILLSFDGDVDHHHHLHPPGHDLDTFLVNISSHLITRWGRTVAKRFSRICRSQQCRTTTWSFQLPGKFVFGSRNFFVWFCLSIIQTSLWLFLLTFFFYFYFFSFFNIKINILQGPVWAGGRQGAGRVIPVTRVSDVLWTCGVEGG